MDEGLRNVIVENYLKKYLPNRFRGCIPIDFLNDIFLKEGESVVVNTSPSFIKKGHFVAIRKDSEKILFFDPLNVSYENCFINQFLKKHVCKIVNLNRRVQDYESKKCGHFCISFILSLEFDTYHNFLNYFVKDELKNNDQIVILLLKKIENYW